MGKQRETAKNTPKDHSKDTKSRADRASLVAQRTEGATPRQTVKPDETSYARKLRERREQGLQEAAPKLTPEQIRREAMALPPMAPSTRESRHQFVKPIKIVAGYDSGSEYVDRVGKRAPTKPAMRQIEERKHVQPRTAPAPNPKHALARSFQEAGLRDAQTSETLMGYDNPLEQKRFNGLMHTALDMRSTRETMQRAGVTADQLARTLCKNLIDTGRSFYTACPEQYAFLFEQRGESRVFDPIALEAVREFAQEIFAAHWANGQAQGAAASAR